MLWQSYLYISAIGAFALDARAMVTVSGPDPSAVSMAKITPTCVNWTRAPAWQTGWLPSNFKDLAVSRDNSVANPTTIFIDFRLSRLFARPTALDGGKYYLFEHKQILALRWNACRLPFAFWTRKGNLIADAAICVRRISSPYADQTEGVTVRSVTCNKKRVGLNDNCAFSTRVSVNRVRRVNLSELPKVSPSKTYDFTTSICVNLHTVISLIRPKLQAPYRLHQSGKVSVQGETEILL